MKSKVKKNKVKNTARKIILYEIDIDLDEQLIEELLEKFDKHCPSEVHNHLKLNWIINNILSDELIAKDKKIQ